MRAGAMDGDDPGQARAARIYTSLLRSEIRVHHTRRQAREYASTLLKECWVRLDDSQMAMAMYKMQIVALQCNGALHVRTSLCACPPPLDLSVPTGAS